MGWLLSQEQVEENVYQQSGGKGYYLRESHRIFQGNQNINPSTKQIVVAWEHAWVLKLSSAPHQPQLRLLFQGHLDLYLGVGLASCASRMCHVGEVRLA